MMKRLLALGVGVCLGATSAAWAGGPGTTNANFLKAGQGVRPISMGETYIALGDGLDTLYWNPAGMNQIASPTATFMHSFWFQDIGTEYLAYGTPLGPLGSLGAGLTYMHAGNIDQTMEDQYGNYAGTNGTASAASLALIGTYGQKLSRLFLVNSPFLNDVLVGASIRIVSETIADKNVFGGGVDVGGIWRQTEELKPTELTTASGVGQGEEGKYAVRDRGWRAGFVAQNLGATTDNLMPINFRAGVGYVEQELFSPLGRGTMTADLLIPIDNDVKVSIGAEYAHISENTEFAARMGYKIGPEIKDLDSTAGFTAGAGVAIQAALIRYQVDYAFVPYGELGSTHRASLTLAFLPNANPVRAVDASPQVVAPLKAEPLPAAIPAASAKKEEKTAAAVPVPAPVVTAPQSEGLTLETTQVDAKPDSKKMFKDAVDRLQNKIKFGMTPGVDFKKGESKFTDKSKAVLDQVGPLLERYPESALTITGFDADKTLAEERAKSVQKYISMSYRIKPAQINVKAGDPTKQPKNSFIIFEPAEGAR